MNTFLYADPHFSHENVCKFTRHDGSKLRPWDNVNEMDEQLIANWNNIVTKQDKVYVLGDVAFKHKHLEAIMPRLNGRKCLIKGNHDICKINQYVKYFYDVRSIDQIDRFLMSHVPIHPESIGKFKGNIHGHLHYKRVMLNETEIDKKYMCVSVEHINYTPIAADILLDQFRKQLGE